MTNSRNDAENDMPINLRLISLLCSALLASAGMALAQKGIAPEELSNMLAAKSKIIVVDVRPASQFIAGHIDGAVNVPFSSVTAYDLSKKKTLVLYCGGVDCSLSNKAAKILTDRGYKDVRVLTGGLPAWERKGFPVIPPAPVIAATPAKAPGIVSKITAAELFKALPEGYSVIDVRSSNEFSAGHIKGAINIPLEGLPGDIPGYVKEKKLVVYDRSSARSAKAAGLLAETGFTVLELTGGLSLWVALGYHVEAGSGPLLE